MDKSKHKQNISQNHVLWYLVHGQRYNMDLYNIRSHLFHRSDVGDIVSYTLWIIKESACMR